MSLCSSTLSWGRLVTISSEAALRRSDNSDGLTLVELLVVLMTMALLIAIAIPTFLGFRGGAQDKAAQAMLTTAEKVSYLVILEEGSVPNRSVLLALLPNLEASIEWLDHKDSSTAPHQVSIDDGAGGQELTLAAMSESGSCYYVRIAVNGAPIRGFVQAAAPCESHDYENGANTGW